MFMNRFGLVMLIVLFAAIPIASAQNVTLIFQPQHSNVLSYCNNTTVDVLLDIPAGISMVSYGQFGIDYNPPCGDIIDRQLNTDIMTGVEPAWSTWNSTFLEDDCWDGDTDWIVFKLWLPKSGPTQVLIGNFTIHCNSTDYCVSDLNFGHKSGCSQGGYIRIWDYYDQQVPHNVSNGTFTCGTPAPPETFSKPLYEGWNLISLPLDPEDNDVDVVLSTVPYDAVYRYDATSKQFESIGGTHAMNPGTGYFVHATEDCIWEYSGTPYTSMDVSLKQGLNMVGWLNCTKDIDALSSISDYYYVARWDTTTEKFEVYNPVAPSAFNDFTTMDRGTGYFISAKQDCTLSKSC